MKARVKATGEIVDVELKQFSDFSAWVSETGVMYNGLHHLDFEVEELQYTPDYWTRLEHTYAGMAMQGLMSILPQIGGLEGRSPKTEIIDIATDVAHALVERMKNKEE